MYLYLCVNLFIGLYSVWGLSWDSDMTVWHWTFFFSMLQATITLATIELRQVIKETK